MIDSKAKLIRTFRKQDNSSNRKMGVFECLHCESEFHGRMERIKIMTGLCKSCANKEGGRKRSSHGYNNSNSRLHVTWSNMKRRCLNPTNKEKRNYANISVCDEWLFFEGFMNWALSNGYKDNLTIDRINPNDGYYPGNCRFVDYSYQSANRRKTPANKSGYIGVWETARGRFRASIQWKGKQNHIGSFSDALSASIARDEFIIKNNLPHTLNRSIEFIDAKLSRDLEKLID